MKQNPSREANRFSASQEIHPPPPPWQTGGSSPHSQVPAICPYPEPARSGPCPPHPTSWRSTPQSSKWSLSLRFPLQNPAYTSPLPHACYMSARNTKNTLNRTIWSKRSPNLYSGTARFKQWLTGFSYITSVPSHKCRDNTGRFPVTSVFLSLNFHVTQNLGKSRLTPLQLIYHTSSVMYTCLECQRACLKCYLYQFFNMKLAK
jgi:hypothetical protein